MFIGMSGIGKTTIANRLDKSNWFHYSIDYRIGTRYLNENIIDQIKLKLVKDQTIKTLLQKDAITIQGNLSVDNLALLSEYVGMLGKESDGGLPQTEFVKRQQQHLAAEIASIEDISDFQKKAQQIYGYEHFLIDSSGSIAEIPLQTLQKLAESTIIVYIKAKDDQIETLIERAKKYPKPLYYDAEFLKTAIDDYCQLKSFQSGSDFSPEAFVQWIFPKLVNHRIPRYQAIADTYGVTISYDDISSLETSEEIIRLIQRTCTGQLN